MQPKTLTTLGELRIGDRFVYPKRVDPWQKMGHTKNNSAINQIAAHNKQPVHKYNELKKNSTPVVFLRHTALVPGEEFFMEDLSVGDVFKTTESDAEYTVISTGYPVYTIRQPNGDKVKAGNVLKVIFVKHG